MVEVGSSKSDASDSESAVESMDSGCGGSAESSGVESSSDSTSDWSITVALIGDTGNSTVSYYLAVADYASGDSAYGTVDADWIAGAWRIAA